MGIFSSKSDTAKALERVANGQNELDAAEFVNLSELIRSKPDGFKDAGTALKGLLKHGSDQTQSRTIDLVRLLIDNGGNEFLQIFEGTGLGERIAHLANKGESRPRAKARDFLKERSAGDVIEPTKSGGEDYNFLAKHALKYDLSSYRQATAEDAEEPGNLEFFGHHKAHTEPLTNDDIATNEELQSVGTRILSTLEQAGPHNGVSTQLLDNAQFVRNYSINRIQSGSASVPDWLFKLHDELAQAIPRAAKYAK